MSIAHRFVETNGIRMHLAEAGSGAPVVLCHGFPESWYSWRHQLEALAKEGFHAIAPDMRGYGQTDKPEAIDQYTLFHLIGDMIGLLDALNIEKAAVIGHDWGAPVASYCALFRPDRFAALATLSVPPFRPSGVSIGSTVGIKTLKPTVRFDTWPRATLLAGSARLAQPDSALAAARYGWRLDRRLP